MKKLIAVLTVLCIAAACPAAFAEDKTFTVGTIQWAPHVALDAATQGFKDVLTEKLGDRVTFLDENSGGDITQLNTNIENVLAAQPDLILANATPVVAATSNATSDIPILGTAVTHYGTALSISDDDWKGYTELNVSGTSDLAPLDGQAAMVKEFFPDAKTVALLYCSAEANSYYQVTTIKNYLEELGYECTFVTFSDSNDVAAAAHDACACDVIYIPTDNTAATFTETIANEVLIEKTPVIAGEEGICAGCGVATLTISYYDLGRATGEMAYEILVNGADVSTMPIAFAPNFTKKYNPAICEELGITVPDGYEAIE